LKSSLICLRRAQDLFHIIHIFCVIVIVSKLFSSQKNTISDSIFCKTLYFFSPNITLNILLQIVLTKFAALFTPITNISTWKVGECFVIWPTSLALGTRFGSHRNDWYDLTEFLMMWGRSNHGHSKFVGSIKSTSANLHEVPHEVLHLRV